ncbi:hypothetical protein QZH41_005471 [Actinostola sp. cb2023]|nr:hypothetical protein QZH41_005471 [Actinostola sp. cb2023]
MVRHSHGTTRSWYDTVIVRHGDGTTRSWYDTVMVRHDHGTTRSWYDTVMVRYGHGTTRSWYDTVMVLHGDGTTWSWYDTVLVRHGLGTTRSWYDTVLVRHGLGTTRSLWYDNTMVRPDYSTTVRERPRNRPITLRHDYYARFKSLRTYTNGFIVSLAVADFFYGALIIPLHVGQAPQVVNSYMLALVLLANITTLMSLTFDRYLVVLHPMVYQPFMEKHFYKVVVASWLLPTVISLLPLFYSSNFGHHGHTVYIYCMVFLGIVLPYLLILLAYVRIFCRVARHVKYLARQKPSDEDSESKQEGKRVTAEAYVARIFVVIAVIFLVSWMPVVYMTFVGNIGRSDLIPKELMIVSWFTLSLGSLVNAPIYAFAKKDFNSVIRKIICYKQRKESLRNTDQELDTGHLMITTT